MDKKVLIVEDSTDTREAMRALVEDRGIKVIEAEDGSEGVERAVIEHPDLILMDIAMPAMDGLSAARGIRSMRELADVPIIAVTAFDDLYRQKALDAGCDEVIDKADFMEHCDELIRRWLEQYA